MKVSCDESLANYVCPESCAGDLKVISEALTGESAGQVLSLETLFTGVPTSLKKEKKKKRELRHVQLGKGG